VSLSRVYIGGYSQKAKAVAMFPMAEMGLDNDKDDNNYDNSLSVHAANRVFAVLVSL